MSLSSLSLLDKKARGGEGRGNEGEGNKGRGGKGDCGHNDDDMTTMLS